MASSDQNEDDIFPTTEEDPIKGGRNILKEMEFRSVRAAGMAYDHSAEYEKTHFYLTIGVTAATAVLSLPFTKIIIDSLSRNIVWVKRSFIYAGSVAVITAGLTYFKLAPGYLLPYYDKQQEKHNKAGAGWQELELRLRAYRATTLESEVELKKIREEIDKFAEQRKEVCLIARPSKEMRDKYKEMESVKKLIKDKKNLQSAVTSYFGTD